MRKLLFPVLLAAVPALVGAAPSTAAAPSAAAASTTIHGYVVHSFSGSPGFVVARGMRLATVLGGGTPRPGRHVVVHATAVGHGIFNARSLRLRHQSHAAISSVRRVRVAGAVTYSDRHRHRYVVSAAGASLMVRASSRTSRIPAAGRSVVAVVSLRADGRLTQRHVTVRKQRPRRVLAGGRIAGVGATAADGTRQVYVSADDDGRSGALLALTVAGDVQLPPFVLRGAAPGAVGPRYDWSAHGTIDVAHPPHRAVGPRVLIALDLVQGPGGVVPHVIGFDSVLADGTTPTKVGTGGPAQSGAGAGATGSSSPVSDLRPYSAASPWNTPIPDNVALNPNSDQLIGALNDNGLPLTADADQYAIPVYNYDAASPRATVHVSGYYSTYDNGDSSRKGYGDNPTITGIPVPAGAVASEGSDGQIVFLDQSSHTEYSFWQWNSDGHGGYTATNGYRYHTSSAYYGRFADGLAGRGAGTPYLAGLVRPWEIAAGHIDHALAFAYDSPAPTYVYPASKSDGDGVAGVDLPEGSRLQLSPSVTDATLAGWGLSPAAIVIAHALQRYGMYVIDNSGSSKIYLEDRMTAGWGSNITRDLVAGIPWQAFRVVAPPPTAG